MVLVKKSVKEQLLQMDRKQRKEFIRNLREKKKPQFKNVQKVKQLWEKLRSSKTKDDKKEELAQQMFELIKGNAGTFIYAHDTSRTLQSLLIYGNQDMRNELFDELTPELLRMCKSQYARFFVVKLLKHGSKRQKEVIINACYGHFANLLQNKISAKIVELIFNDYANAQQRFDIISEFFGKEFILFKSQNSFKSLKDVHDSQPEKVELIVKNLGEILQSIVEKEQFALTLSHALLANYFAYCTKAQKLEMIDLIKERLPEICHSKEGAEVAMQCVWFSDAKDRKAILKTFKGLSVKSAMDQFARRVLFAIFDSVDDTVTVNKFITKELSDNVSDLIYDKWGVTVLHYIVHPRDVRVFSSGGLVSTLKEGDGNEHSKKKSSDRYKQIFDCMKENLYAFISANMRELLYNKVSATLILDALEPSGADDPVQRELENETLSACFEKISEVAGEEYIPNDLEVKNEEKHIMQGGPARFVLKKLLKVDKDQPNVKLSEFMSQLPKDQLAMFAATNSGCFDLLHMMQSGSEAARKAVKNSVNIVSLKKKTNFPGAVLLLEEIQK